MINHPIKQALEALEYIKDYLTDCDSGEDEFYGFVFFRDEIVIPAHAAL